LENAGPLVHDPWALRDDYVLVMLDSAAQARQALLQQHVRRELQPDEHRQLWNLLESQRFAMYMYTSCGWFFADVSGIETVQNMAYACRAIELAQPWQRLDLEEMLLEYLGEARSNLAELGTGADVYLRFVHPQRVRPTMVAAGVAIGAAVMQQSPAERQFRHRIRTLRFEPDRTTEPPAAWHALLELEHLDTAEQVAVEAHLYQAGPGDLRCYVLVVGDRGEDGSARPRFPDQPAEHEVQAAEGIERFTLRDLVAEDREAIISTAYESILQSGEELLTQLHEQGRELIATCRNAGVEPPPVLRAAAAHVLTRTLGEKAAALERSLRDRLGGSDASPREGGQVVAEEQAQRLEEIAELLNFSRDNELEVSIDALVRAYGGVIRELLERLLTQPDARWAEQCVEVIRSSYELHFPLDRRPLEDLAYRVLWKHREDLRAVAKGQSESESRRWTAFQSLAEALHLNIHWILEQENGTPADSGE
jgi:hypothetical protein